MTRGRIQVWHDYKPQGKPRDSKHHLRWFVLSAAVPLTGLALYFLFSGAPELETAPAADAAPVVETTGNFQVTGVPLDLPGAGAPGTATLGQALAQLPVEQGVPLTLTVKTGDSMDRLFGRHELSRADLAAILALEPAREAMRLVHPGDTIEIRHEQGTILRLNRRIDETRELEVSRDADGGYQSRVIEHPVETRVVFTHGEIDNSLFEAGREAGISDKVTMSLAGIFAWDIDFVLDIRKGDEFVVLYEELWQDGNRLRDGDILAAEFVNNGRTVRAVRYTDEGGRSDYYSPEGQSMRKAFIRAPVDFTRISSNFNLKRKHPILNKIRAHKGVDYAAPNGTPIKAAGDGKVIFAGRKGGYGNCVIVQHGGNITTLYAHMSRFSKLGRVGTRVSQGQVIGYVGASGLATAPHLHYEYQLNGTHRNPRTVKLPQANPIAEQYRAAFNRHADAMMSQLDMVRQTRMSLVAAE